MDRVELINLFDVYESLLTEREKEIFKLVRDNDSKNDWSYKKTDEELKKFIHRFHEKNQFLIRECKKYGFKYIDTHKDREKVLNEVFNYICEEMKK